MFDMHRGALSNVDFLHCRDLRTTPVPVISCELKVQTPTIPSLPLLLAPSIVIRACLLE